jgi:hypothetical protein
MRDDLRKITLETILQDVKNAKESEAEHKRCSDKLSEDFQEFIKTEEGMKAKEEAWKNLSETDYLKIISEMKKIPDFHYKKEQ